MRPRQAHAMSGYWIGIGFTGTGRFSQEWEHLSRGQGHLSQGVDRFFIKTGYFSQELDKERMRSVSKIGSL